MQTVTAALLVTLIASASASVAEDDSPDESGVASRLLAPECVSLLSWGESNYAAYCVDGRVQVFDRSAELVGVIQLPSDITNPSGKIFPDPLILHEDSLFHLDKTESRVSKYGRDGDPQGRIDLNIEAPDWFQVVENRVWVLGTGPPPQDLRYEIYSSRGGLQDTRQPWLRGEGEFAYLASGFFFHQREYSYYVPFYHPYIHVEGPGIEATFDVLELCSEVFPPGPRNQLEAQADRFGAPEPLGEGLSGTPLLAPAFLAATTEGSRLLAVANGSVLVRLDAQGLNLSCTPLPASSPHFSPGVRCSRFFGLMAWSVRSRSCPGRLFWV